MQEAVEFNTSPIIFYTLLFWSLVFFSLCVVVVASLIIQRRFVTEKRTFVFRGLLGSLILFALFLCVAFATVYTSSRKVVVYEEKIEFQSLFEKEVVFWEDVESVKGNFLAAKNREAWVEFNLKNGRVIRFPLSFIWDQTKLEEIINQRLSS